MSQRYGALLAQWRVAAAETRRAQRLMQEQFERHLAGEGPPPTEADIQRLRELRVAEAARLEAAMEYVRETAHGPATGFGRT